MLLCGEGGDWDGYCPLRTGRAKMPYQGWKQIRSFTQPIGGKRMMGEMETK
jgi:hypothetical protein